MRKQVNSKYEQDKYDYLLDLIYCDVIDGKNTRHIVEKIMEGIYTNEAGEPYPKRGKNYAYTAVSKAMERYLPTSITEEEREEKRKIYRERLQNVYSEALAMGQYQTAMNALKELSKVEGIDEPEKLEVTGNIEDKIEISFKF